MSGPQRDAGAPWSSRARGVATSPVASFVPCSRIGFAAPLRSKRFGAVHRCASPLAACWRRRPLHGKRVVELEQFCASSVPGGDVGAVFGSCALLRQMQLRQRRQRPSHQLPFPLLLCSSLLQPLGSNDRHRVPIRPLQGVRTRCARDRRCAGPSGQACQRAWFEAARVLPADTRVSRRCSRFRSRNRSQNRSRRRARPP